MRYQTRKNSRLFNITVALVACAIPVAMMPQIALAQPGQAQTGQAQPGQAETVTVQASADSTLQSWADEKVHSMNAKPYIAALQPQGHGIFGERFESTDTTDGTDAKTAMITFDLSGLNQIPQNATLDLTYLGWAGGHVPQADDTNTITIVAVDDHICTNNAQSCATGEATWATRPRFNGEDGRAVAVSQPFAFGNERYSDHMNVHNPTTVSVDVTAILAKEFASGDDHKMVTLMVGENKHYDMRFASTEGVGTFNGATSDMAPKLRLTMPEKDSYLSVNAPDKNRYQIGEPFDPAGMEVKIISRTNNTETILTPDQYTVTGIDYDVNQVGAHAITVTANDDETLTTTFLVYTLGETTDEGELSTADDDMLWYTKPASQTKLRLSAGSVGEGENNRWQQTTLPIGNGKIGGTVWGEVGVERITFNEETLWTGGPGTVDDYNGGNNENKGREGVRLRELNRQLQDGADTVDPGALTGGEDARQQGSYQNWGNIEIDYGFGDDAQYTNYRRDLNLSKGLATVGFTHNGTDYTREYFASNPDDVMVARLTANGDEELNLTISLNANPGFSKKDASSTVNADILTVRGALGNNGLIYNSKIKAVTDSGTIGASSNGQALTVYGAREVILYIAAATDFEYDYPRYRTGEDAAAVDARVAQSVQKAANKGYGKVRSDHIADHSSLYSRLTLDLGQHETDGTKLTTEELLDAYSAGTATTAQKRELETAVYQYGRYLQIGSSRENSPLPANLQGIWSSTADDNAHGRTPWGSDFHMNVNLQMNYWPTYSANLAELAQPVITYAAGLVEPGRETARIYAGAHTQPGTPPGEGAGYMAHTENTAYGWTTPGAAFSWGWSPAAMPWLLQNVYEAYEYGGDLNQLRTEIYPLLKEESNFYVDYMLHKGFLPAADGQPRLTTGVAYSAEHGPLGTDGNTYESSLVWQMLNDAIESAQALDVDDHLVGNLDNCRVENWAKDNNGEFSDSQANRSWMCAQSLLKPIEVGHSGQIKEWYFEGELGKKQDGSPIPHYQVNHRHMSHMLGLFPGDLITVDNPTYMDAAKTSMTYRGDDATGWGVGQRINSWARTGDGNHAYQLIEKQLKNAMYSNLFDVHPPFQIDGNFGNTSGVNEMLLQSNSTFVSTSGQRFHNYTNILPALPDEWSDGNVRGLRARGGFSVGIDWKEGKAERVILESVKGNQANIKVTKGDAGNYSIVRVPALEASGFGFRQAVTSEPVDATVVENANGERIVSFDTQPGDIFVMTARSETVAVTDLTITGKADMSVGEKQLLMVVVAPESATDAAVSWKSAKPEVASVDETGQVSALASGTTTVTATSVSNPDVTGTFEVMVTVPDVPDVPEVPDPDVPDVPEVPDPDVPDVPEVPDPDVPGPDAPAPDAETPDDPTLPGDQGGDDGDKPRGDEPNSPESDKGTGGISDTNTSSDGGKSDNSDTKLVDDSAKITRSQPQAKHDSAKKLATTGISGMFMLVTGLGMVLVGAALFASRRRES